MCSASNDNGRIYHLCLCPTKKGLGAESVPLGGGPTLT